MLNILRRDTSAARVNIKLDLHTGGAKKSVSLPFKLLVIGNFGSASQSLSLANSKKHRLYRENFDAVLNQLKPELTLVTTNKLTHELSEMKVKLCFKAMKDFQPEEVARQIPELKLLLAMRNLLCDLKSNLFDNNLLCQKL